MSTWNLSVLLAELHDDIQRRLAVVRKTMGHPVAKGDAAESVWTELLAKYLPQRYQAAPAFVVDSKGKFSDQIDVVVFDRQYSPFIFNYQGQTVVPAESVYAVFEAKQAINAGEVRYAQEKVGSVRTLHRTSLPIPHAGGVYPPKPLPHIFGGLLTFESDWSPPLGTSLLESLTVDEVSQRLDLGCVAAHGYYVYDRDAARYDLCDGGRPATAFLFTLISKLQANATVPMIDVQAYAEWLSK
jgi:hypothetical protein